MIEGFAQSLRLHYVRWSTYSQTTSSNLLDFTITDPKLGRRDSDSGTNGS